MAACADLRELVLLLPDGQLAAAEAARVREHLAQCEDCRRLLADVEEMRSVLRAEVPAPAPAALRGRVEARLEQADGGRLLRLPSIAAAVAAAVLVAWVLWAPLDLPRRARVETVAERRGLAEAEPPAATAGESAGDDTAAEPAPDDVWPEELGVFVLAPDAGAALERTLEQARPRLRSLASLELVREAIHEEVAAGTKGALLHPQGQAPAGESARLLKEVEEGEAIAAEEPVAADSFQPAPPPLVVLRAAAPLDLRLPGTGAGRKERAYGYGTEAAPEGVGDATKRTPPAQPSPEQSRDDAGAAGVARSGAPFRVQVLELPATDLPGFVERLRASAVVLDPPSLARLGALQVPRAGRERKAADSETRAGAPLGDPAARVRVILVLGPE